MNLARSVKFTHNLPPFYDTSVESPRDMLDLIRRVPGLVLIGLDPNTQNVLVFSGQFSPLVNFEALAGVIQKTICNQF